MKVTRAGIGIAGVLLLASCAAAPNEAKPTPTPTPVSANKEVCEAFSAVTATMSDALNADDVNYAWAAVRDEMDAAMLEATGDVKERLRVLVDEWPSGANLWVHQDFTEINQKLNDVGRACGADDAGVDVYTFVTD